MFYIEYTNDVHGIFRILHDNLKILWIFLYSSGIYGTFRIQTEYFRNILLSFTEL